MAKKESDHGLSTQQKLKYAAAFLALTGVTFLLGMWIMFPAASLERRLNAELAHQLPVPVTIQQLKCSFPLTLTSAHVRVELEQFPIEIAPLKLKPAWSKVLFFKPGITAAGKMFGGSFNILHTAGSGTTEINARNMHIGGVIPGFNSITLQARLDSADINATLGAGVEIHTGTVTLKALTLTGLEKLGLNKDEINFGDFTLAAHTENQRLQLELANPQGVFGLKANGFIAPPQLSPQARLNIEIRIGNMPAEYAQLEELLSLAGVRKNTDGYLLRLSGRLDQPYLR
ncbi:MAG: type II secretion system protein GspN [Desulfuromonadaceae bacterium]|jgi:type II secretion system protein N|nr:type II secretion system protein GspN [Desulfuromonas sp.]MDY0184327.1 type II secretion system protein GspN [Desulfuromonadaceae bacterium]